MDVTLNEEVNPWEMFALHYTLYVQCSALIDTGDLSRNLKILQTGVPCMHAPRDQKENGPSLFHSIR